MAVVTTQKHLLEDIWTLLGHPIRRKEPAWSTLLEARESLLEHRLPYTALMKISIVLHVGMPDEIAQLIGTSSTTLKRRKKEHRLNVEESISVFRIAEITARATEVFGDRDIAIQWMKESNRALGGKTPLSLLNDDIGRKLVEDALGRIEHGIYS